MPVRDAHNNRTHQREPRHAEPALSESNFAPASKPGLTECIQRKHFGLPTSPFQRGSCCRIRCALRRKTRRGPLGSVCGVSTGSAVVIRGGGSVLLLIQFGVVPLFHLQPFGILSAFI